MLAIMATQTNSRPCVVRRTTQGGHMTLLTSERSDTLDIYWRFFGALGHVFQPRSVDCLTPGSPPVLLPARAPSGTLTGRLLKLLWGRFLRMLNDRASGVSEGYFHVSGGAALKSSTLVRRERLFRFLQRVSMEVPRHHHKKGFGSRCSRCSAAA